MYLVKLEYVGESKRESHTLTFASAPDVMSNFWEEADGGAYCPEDSNLDLETAEQVINALENGVHVVFELTLPGQLTAYADIKRV